MKTHQNVMRSVFLVTGLAVALFSPDLALSQMTPSTAQPATSTAAADKMDEAWKGQILLGMQQTRAARDQCLQEGLQAEKGRQAALLNSKITEGAIFARLANEKVACVERAEEELARAQSLLDAGRGTVAAAGSRFQQEYKRGLRAFLAGLQQLAQRLREPEAVKYEAFTAQMDGYSREIEDFKNHYIRLINTDENPKLASTIFRISDLLIASAGAWRREIEAERAVSRWTEPGDWRAAAARRERDAAAENRGEHWRSALLLIQEAQALAEAR